MSRRTMLPDGLFKHGERTYTEYLCFVLVIICADSYL
jgi:hypothetical protein